MSLHQKQVRVLELFERLNYIVRKQHPVPDPRLKDVVGILPVGAVFSCFYPPHLNEARRLCEVYLAAKDFDDFIDLAKNARQFVNETLFAFATEVAILHREDCKGLSVPPVQEVFVDKFINAVTLNQAYIQALTRTAADETPIIVNLKESGNVLDPEYKLAYFREDIGANAHHWHWHIVYPSIWDPKVFGKKKDRRGELFYYMHQQMCARYDCERLSNDLNRMVPFHNFKEFLEGYDPHLAHLASGRYYAFRPEEMAMSDMKEVDVQDMERWRERILDAIHLGHVHDTHGKEVPLDDEHGADLLGSLIESNAESINPLFYGSLHNWGHVMMAHIHDPDGKFLETPGVMTDTATSLRDPIFYRYHRFIDNMFQEYKAHLPTYSKEQLNFPDVSIVGVTVNARTNDVINTFMKEDELELSHSINVGRQGSVKVRYQHLDHESYSYTIDTVNNGSTAKKATVRIFLAPKYDELGNEIHIDTQRRLFIELDKFTAEIKPGKNTIVRSSVDSSVTLAHQYTFEELEKGEGLDDNRTEFCSCGWPQHLLVPKGNIKGMVFHLFVMLTDFEHDKVGDGLSSRALCADAVSYCGAKDEKYPDKRSMGFPFDRDIPAHNHEEFLTSNMALKEITIRFIP
ncbi:hemocyanin A chain-like [Centruroides vittatus]|uniref:hemocyanin A chain-like n=1 Tax=Centruroides vittatus TaxID=120091 RepID=UPI0035103150